MHLSKSVIEQSAINCVQSVLRFQLFFRIARLPESAKMTSQPSLTAPTADTPPFTSEQLAWIDRLVTARQAQVPHRPTGTDHSAAVSMSPGPLLTMVASQPGKLPAEYSPVAMFNTRRWPREPGSGGRP